MTLLDLRNYCKEVSRQHPEHSEEISDLYDLAEMEVDDGASQWNECEIAISAIDDLIND